MEQTLLLNATYEPLRVVHWQKAITLWCQGKVEIVAHYDREVRSVSFSIKLPSVIRLLRRIRVRRSVEYVPFSRANIYARDNLDFALAPEGDRLLPMDDPQRLVRRVEQQGLLHLRRIITINPSATGAAPPRGR